MHPSLHPSVTSGIHLAYSRGPEPPPPPTPSAALYRLAAVAAALLLVVSIF